jgi:hypothetical protein
LNLSWAFLFGDYMPIKKLKIKRKKKEYTEEDYQKELREMEEIGKENRRIRQINVEKNGFINGVEDIFGHSPLMPNPFVIHHFLQSIKEEETGAKDVLAFYMMHLLCSSCGIKVNQIVINDLLGFSEDYANELADYLKGLLKED